MAKTRRHGDNRHPLSVTQGPGYGDLAKTRRHGDNRHPLSYTKGPGYGKLGKTIRPKYSNM